MEFERSVDLITNLRPVRYAVNPDLDLWYVAGKGRVTGADYLECLVKSAAHPDFHLDIDLILDIRQVSDLDVTFSELRQIYRMDLALAGEGNDPGYRAAILVRSFSDTMLPTLYGAMVKSSGVFIKTFYELGDALVWLGRAHQEEKIFGLLGNLLE